MARRSRLSRRVTGLYATFGVPVRIMGVHPENRFLTNVGAFIAKISEGHQFAGKFGALGGKVAETRVGLSQQDFRRLAGDKLAEMMLAKGNVVLPYAHGIHSFDFRRGKKARFRGILHWGYSPTEKRIRLDKKELSEGAWISEEHIDLLEDAKLLAPGMGVGLRKIFAQHREDEDFMNRARKLAKKSKHKHAEGFNTGAVVVVPMPDGTQSVFTGFKGEGGGVDHAEIVALEKAKEACGDLSKATLYALIEPCSYRNPQHNIPHCSQLIPTYGISRIVIAGQDLNPRVRGKGIRELNLHGIQITLFDPNHPIAVWARNRNLEFFLDEQRKSESVRARALAKRARNAGRRA